MKTPMQELITAIRLTKYSEINEQAWEAYDYVIDIAESMLEKEKDVMKSCIVAGMEFIPVDPNHYSEDAEEIYKEIFNTSVEMKAGHLAEDLVDDFVKQWRKENNTEDAVYAAYHYDAMVAFAEYYKNL